MQNDFCLKERPTLNVLICKTHGYVITIVNLTMLLYMCMNTNICFSQDPKDGILQLRFRSYKKGPVLRIN